MSRASEMTEPFVFDLAEPVHRKALARLQSEQVAWFGTNGRDGFPHAVPIWFLWRDGWLATAILLGSGPGVWLVVGLIRARRRPGHREPVGRRALGGPGAGAAR